MERQKGKLIVIDGTDGSGKATQTDMLIKRMRAAHLTVETVSFPRYDEPSSTLVRKYLAGEFGTASEVDPKIASTFYAVDRWAASEQIRGWLNDGANVVMDRFVASNMGHQGGKFPNQGERLAFFRWLFDLEHGEFGIPKPDLNVILHVPTERSDRLMDDRGRDRDIHESDPEHLRAAEQVYLEIAELFPDDFTLIECMRDGKLMSRGDIHSLVWVAASHLLLPERQPA
ncbi:MAG: thymidylate kinase [Patescibacteria group bacterium]|nr:thymidylate kinase [Patescibacteria group bacterium]